MREGSRFSRRFRGRVRGLAAAAAALAVALVVVVVTSPREAPAQQPAQACANVPAPYRMNGAPLQQPLVPGVASVVSVPASESSAPQVTIGPQTLVGAEVLAVQRVMPSTNPAFAFVVVTVTHVHAPGEVVWPTWQGNVCAPPCAAGTNDFPRCMPACPQQTPCVLPAPGAWPNALPQWPQPAPQQVPVSWIAYQGGWAMQVPPNVNPVTVPQVPWQSPTPPPPQATVFQQASSTQGAIPQPTTGGQVVYVPAAGQWLMVPSGSWMGAKQLYVPPLPPLNVPLPR